MEQYISKYALVAEINALLDDKFQCNSYDEATGFQNALTLVKKFINTLEVKEVDLEEKATQLSQKYFPDEENIWARPNIEAQRCKSACIEMVEWFKAQKGEGV